MHLRFRVTGLKQVIIFVGLMRYALKVRYTCSRQDVPSWGCSATLLAKNQPDYESRVIVSCEAPWVGERPLRKRKTWLESNIRNSQVVVDALRGSSVKLGTIQRILAWPLRKDDKHTSRSGSYIIVSKLLFLGIARPLARGFVNGAWGECLTAAVVP